MIYTPIHTGFCKEDKIKTTDLANKIASATSKIGK